MAHEMLHLDGKIWRTLRLLFFKPGFLAAEYAAGRRRPYVDPVRIFLIAIVAYALLTRGGMNFVDVVNSIFITLCQILGGALALASL